MLTKLSSALAIIALLAFSGRGFQGGPVLVADAPLQHKAFVDCNNVNIRKVAKMTKANWRWTIVINDWDRDGLKNDILFLGNGSRHRVAPHNPPEAINNALARIQIDQVCDNAAGQAAQVPQLKTNRVDHGNHTDFIQVRADAQPVGVRISVQLDHLLPGVVADTLDAALSAPEDCNSNGVPDEEESGDGSQDQNDNGVLDECESDGDDDGVPDDMDPDEQNQPDCNGDGISDELEIALELDADVDGDGVPDACAADQVPEPEDANLLTWLLWGVAALVLILVAWRFWAGKKEV